MLYLRQAGWLPGLSATREPSLGPAAPAPFHSPSRTRLGGLGRGPGGGALLAVPGSKRRLRLPGTGLRTELKARPERPRPVSTVGPHCRRRWLLVLLPARGLAAADLCSSGLLAGAGAGAVLCCTPYCRRRCCCAGCCCHGPIYFIISNMPTTGTSVSANKQSCLEALARASRSVVGPLLSLALASLPVAQPRSLGAVAARVVASSLPACSLCLLAGRRPLAPGDQY